MRTLAMEKRRYITTAARNRNRCPSRSEKSLAASSSARTSNWRIKVKITTQRLKSWISTWCLTFCTWNWASIVHRPNHRRSWSIWCALISNILRWWCSSSLTKSCTTLITFQSICWDKHKTLQWIKREFNHWSISNNREINNWATSRKSKNRTATRSSRSQLFKTTYMPLGRKAINLVVSLRVPNKRRRERDQMIRNKLYRRSLANSQATRKAKTSSKISMANRVELLHPEKKDMQATIKMDPKGIKIILATLMSI